MTISTYSLKPQFQCLLMPLRNFLIRQRISPNAVTLTSCFLCIVYAGLLLWTNSSLFILGMPLFLLLRMIFNALDGMIASATDSQSALGSILNEICDVISDFALFVAFVLILPVPLVLWWLLIALSVLSEFISLAVYQATGTRPFFGPFGKSDRALYLGIFAILLLLYPDTEMLIQAYIIVGISLASLTIYNRLKISLLYKP
jgi:CDP-diacylglycerol--glycerol-3-phosphate 3-phosphatidyltransferase